MSLPKPNRVQVQSYRVSNKPVTVDVSATNGAAIGTNLWDADGNLITQAQWNALSAGKSSSTSTFSGTTDDVNEGQYNLYFTNRRAQDAVGAILANTANIILTYVGGTSIKADLTTVTLTSGGSLELLGFDAYGRLSETAAASTTNLAEGTNLYFTNARVAAYIATVAGQPSGLATLDSGGKVPITQLPAAAISQTYVVNSQAAMLALAADVGDICVRTDINETFILQTLPASTLANWVQLLFPTAGVSSFNGRTGVVNPASGDYSFSLISGTASIAQGGTGQTTASAAFAALSPLTTNGDMLVYGGGANTRLPAGTNTYVLTMVSGAPTWAAPASSGGTVTSVQVAAPAQFNVTGGPITTSGTITLAWANQNANLIFAGPASGAAAAPTFRAMVAADLPMSAIPGRLINIQRFNTHGTSTYTPTAGTNQIIVDFQASGAAGGSSSTCTASQVSAGGGGGSGGFARVWFTSGFSGGLTVTIGQGGIAATAGGNAGGNGGTTSFGSLITATGATGGNGATASTWSSATGTSGMASGGAGGPAPTVTGGTTLLLVAGTQGWSSAAASPNGIIGGLGAGSILGSITPMFFGGTLRPAVGPGSGSSGSASTNSQAGIASDPGNDGLITVYEFS